MTKELLQAIEDRANEIYLSNSEHKLHFIDGMKEVILHPESYGLTEVSNNENYDRNDHI